MSYYMKPILRLLKKGNYNAVYCKLKENNYEYTLDNLKKDFSNIDSKDMFCYLIYLLSKDRSINHTLLICDFLMYTDTFFYDIYPVIKMIVQHTLSLSNLNSSSVELKRWVLDIFWGNPDCPFNTLEMEQYAMDILKENPNDEYVKRVINEL